MTVPPLTPLCSARAVSKGLHETAGCNVYACELRPVAYLELGSSTSAAAMRLCREHAGSLARQLASVAGRPTRLLRESLCKFCSAPIAWGRNPAGKLIPIEREPITVLELAGRPGEGSIGLQVLTSSGAVIRAGKVPPGTDKAVSGHETHFQRCNMAGRPVSS